MAHDAPSSSHPSESDLPVVVHCGACQKTLSAPATMLGELVECPFCQHQFIIERPAAAETPTAGKRDGAIVQAELSSLEGQLRENVTQITELRGNVSRLNMELHRHQLRMKDLADRQAELNAGIAAAKAELGA